MDGHHQRNSATWVSGKCVSLDSGIQTINMIVNWLDASGCLMRITTFSSMFLNLVSIVIYFGRYFWLHGIGACMLSREAYSIGERRERERANVGGWEEEVQRAREVKVSGVRCSLARKNQVETTQHSWWVGTGTSGCNRIVGCCLLLPSSLHLLSFFLLYYHRLLFSTVTVKKDGEVRCSCCCPCSHGFGWNLYHPSLFHPLLAHFWFKTVWSWICSTRSLGNMLPKPSWTRWFWVQKILLRLSVDFSGRVSKYTKLSTARFVWYTQSSWWTTLPGGWERERERMRPLVIFGTQYPPSASPCSNLLFSFLQLFSLQPKSCIRSDSSSYS